MAKHTVFESTNMASTKGAERIFDAVATTDIDNGTFGYLDGLADGESNVYKFVAGTKKGGQVVVVDQPAWTEENDRLTSQRKDKFVIEAGTKFIVRVVKVNDEFGITLEGVTSESQSAMDTDAFVTIDATTGKLVASATTTASAIMEGSVMRKRTIGGVISTTAHNYGYTSVMYEVKVATLA